MNFLLDISINTLPEPISYRDRVLLTGSCFTEHIGSALQEMKFQVLQNPNGILFGPESVCRSLLSYVRNEPAGPEDLFRLNEVWHSWQYHSRFSHIHRSEALRRINDSRQQAHEFLRRANWVVLTLGSSFSYRLTRVAQLASEKTGSGVTNCHRAPANWFSKEMLETVDIRNMLEDCLEQLRMFNPGLKFIFTISPVRHIRDGVVENNRSKARLIEAVHGITQKFENVFYFPAYELVIDVLRDYRFYDADLVHPNYAATEFVMEKFTESCIDESSQQLMKDLKPLLIARKHRAFQPETEAHRQFLLNHLEKTKMLKEKYPFLDLADELNYFSESSVTR